MPSALPTAHLLERRNPMEQHPSPPTSPSPMTCRQLIDEYFIENRTKLLDLAAFLDRLDRAEEEALSHQRSARPEPRTPNTEYRTPISACRRSAKRCRRSAATRPRASRKCR